MITASTALPPSLRQMKGLISMDWIRSVPEAAISEIDRIIPPLSLKGL